MRLSFLAAMACAMMAIAPAATAKQPEVKTAPQTASPASVPTTPPPLPAALRGDYFVARSQEIGRNFEIYVQLPEGYDPNRKEAYPVIYILDGDSVFPMLAPTQLFLTYDEKLPPAILVGIAYGGFNPEVNKRNIDFNFVSAEMPKGEDGAANFLRFMKEDLIPQIERRYHGDPARRVLVGQSLGGNFVMWSAYKDPDLFWGRIASNASARRWFIDTSPAPSKRASMTSGGVVYTSGTRDRPDLRAHAERYFAHMATQQKLPWRFHPITIDGGTHAADLGQAYSEAMLWLFRDAVGQSK